MLQTRENPRDRFLDSKPTAASKPTVGSKLMAVRTSMVHPKQMAGLTPRLESKLMDPLRRKVDLKQMAALTLMVESILMAHCLAPHCLVLLRSAGG